MKVSTVFPLHEERQIVGRLSPVEALEIRHRSPQQALAATDGRRIAPLLHAQLSRSRAPQGYGLRCLSVGPSSRFFQLSEHLFRTVGRNVLVQLQPHQHPLQQLGLLAFSRRLRHDAFNGLQGRLRFVVVHRRLCVLP